MDILHLLALASLTAVHPPTATIPPPPILNGGCEAERHTLLLDGHTVLRNIRWRISGAGPDHADSVGCGEAIPHRAATGHFWFFASDNLELSCKALDGTALTGAYWVFCGALTDVEWWMDAINNANPTIQRQYYNPPGTMASFGDVFALPAGPNHAPHFVSPCGQTFTIPLGVNGFIRVEVMDPDGDDIVATVRQLEGPTISSLSPNWTNPVPGIGASLEAWMDFPTTPEDLLFEFAISDGKVLVSPRCRIGIRTRPTPAAPADRKAPLSGR